MKKFLLRFYLVFEYLLSLVWFVIGTLFYIIGIMFITENDCILCMIKTYGMRYVFVLVILTFIYIFVSYCLISSIRSTHKLLKNKVLTLKNKTFMFVTFAINIALIIWVIHLM